MGTVIVQLALAARSTPATVITRVPTVAVTLVTGLALLVVQVCVAAPATITFTAIVSVKPMLLVVRLRFVIVKTSEPISPTPSGLGELTLVSTGEVGAVVVSVAVAVLPMPALLLRT